MTDPALKTDYAPAKRASPETLDRQAGMYQQVPLLQELSDALPDILVILNQERQIVYANRRLIELLELAHWHHVIGKRPGEALHCLHASQTEAGYRRDSGSAPAKRRRTRLPQDRPLRGQLHIATAIGRRGLHKTSSGQRSPHSRRREMHGPFDPHRSSAGAEGTGQYGQECPGGHHQGSVWFTSGEETGTTFFNRLPHKLD